MTGFNFSDHIMSELRSLGFTHCFFVPGGNSAYLLESARTRFECVSFVHEVGAAIATEYFNESSPPGKRAFSLLTAGPALTNSVTAVASSWIEGRELVIVGGQAKSPDLRVDGTRQRGFQEIDGVELLKSITKKSIRLKPSGPFSEVRESVQIATRGRPGPIFMEVCLDDSQAAYGTRKPTIQKLKLEVPADEKQKKEAAAASVVEITKLILGSTRPIMLLGGGITRMSAPGITDRLEAIQIPVGTTFNGTDRVGADFPNYCGTPNWYGSRWSNLVVQQADLIVAVGARLGVLDTGYNWEEFAPGAKIVRIDVDNEGLLSGRPSTFLEVTAAPDDFLGQILDELDSKAVPQWEAWKASIHKIRKSLDTVDPANTVGLGYVEFMSFVRRLSDQTLPSDIVIPCSSGGAFEGTMRMIRPKAGQIIITDKGLASMGYGLSGAIGASIGFPGRRTILVEGDGGFAQNLQELGVVRNRNLNLKIFIIDNQGYASIKANQIANFAGNYIGCNNLTGLTMPDWNSLSEAFGIAHMAVDSTTVFNSDFQRLFNSEGPAVFVVKCDPDQILYPRIGSTINSEGIFESRPLHKMNPYLDEHLYSELTPYL